MIIKAKNIIMYYLIRPISAEINISKSYNNVNVELRQLFSEPCSYLSLLCDDIANLIIAFISPTIDVGDILVYNNSHLFRIIDKMVEQTDNDGDTNIQFNFKPYKCNNLEQDVYIIESAHDIPMYRRYFYGIIHDFANKKHINCCDFKTDLYYVYLIGNTNPPHINIYRRKSCQPF